MLSYIIFKLFPARVRVATIALEIGIALILVPFVFVHLFDLGFKAGALANLFFATATLMVLMGIMIMPVESVVRKDAPVSKRFATSFIMIGKGLFLVFFLLSVSTIWREPISNGAILLGKAEPEIVSGELISVHASPFTILFSRSLEILQEDGTKLELVYRYPKRVESGEDYNITIAPNTNLVLSIETI